MRLISLNIWGGILSKELIKFLETSKGQTDIYCFQEVWNNANQSQFPSKFKVFNPNIFADLRTTLKGFDAYFAPANSGMVGIAMFVRHSIKVTGSGEMFMYPFPANPNAQNQAENLGKKFQYLEIRKGARRFTICNIHGIWDKRRGMDTDLRLVQSRNIQRFLKRTPGPKVLCGDLNLLPTTKSLKVAEKGMRNLVKEFGVTSTKNQYSGADSPGKVVDYILTSPEVRVKGFKVIPKEVSDHMPLWLEFD